MASVAGETVCLTMIVKDEATVIRRCLDSVLPLIDRWVIVDTGSSDGTQEIVREHMRDVPGTLVERPFVNFAHNRNEAIALARDEGDYLFMIDADEVVELVDGFVLPRLEADSYDAAVLYAGCTYLRKQFVRAALPWRYRGVVHEYLECREARSEAFLPGLWTIPHRDGARARDPTTYRRDAILLERALLDEPDNSRHVFYLAQSYRDAGELELAIHNYERRAAMGGWVEEVWYSLYQVAVLKERLERPWPETMAAYLAAHQLQPDRAEPLFRVGAYYGRREDHHLAHLFLARAHEIPGPPPGRLFVERSLYDYAIAFEYAVASYHVGDHAGAIDANNRLLRSAVPPEMAEHAVRIRRRSVDALSPPGRRLPAPRLTVALVLGSSGPELDDCVEGLLRQDAENFGVAVLDRGIAAGLGDRLPLDDPRFELLPAGATLDQLAGARRAEEAILVLAPADALAGPSALRRVQAAFEDEACALVYGQHRTPSGRLGDAEPAPSDAAFEERGPALAGRSPIAFRARLAQRAAQDDELRAALWRGASLAGTRFLDDVLTIAAAPAPGARSRAAGASSGPLVSALLVAGDRVTMAKRAILSFAAQTHANRELVVVTGGSPRVRRALELYVAALGLDSVRFVDPDGTDVARGDFVCKWDSGHFSHPERIERQLARILERDAGACFLTDHLQLLEDHRLLFWIDWTGGGRIDGVQSYVPATAMLARGVRFPDESVPVVSLEDAGHLWLHTYRGDEGSAREHRARMNELGAPRAFVGEREQRIREALAHHAIPRPTVVSGRDGPAFAVR